MKKIRLLGALYACALAIFSLPANTALVTDLNGDAVTGSFATYDITSIDALIIQTGGIPASSSQAPSNVPIPSAIWLFGSGLVGLVGMARRKKA